MGSIRFEKVCKAKNLKLRDFREARNINVKHKLIVETSVFFSKSMCFFRCLTYDTKRATVILHWYGIQPKTVFILLNFK